MNEKYAVMSPFNIIHEILGPQLWASNSRKTLSDKMELYFQDYSFVPLFMQENYLKTSPQRTRGLDGPEKAMEDLKLMDQAASSISDGDLVDALIHGFVFRLRSPLSAIDSDTGPSNIGPSCQRMLHYQLYDQRHSSMGLAVDGAVSPRCHSRSMCLWLWLALLDAQPTTDGLARTPRQTSSAGRLVTFKYICASKSLATRLKYGNLTFLRSSRISCGH